MAKRVMVVEFEFESDMSFEEDREAFYGARLGELLDMLNSDSTVRLLQRRNLYALNEGEERN